MLTKLRAPLRRTEREREREREGERVRSSHPWEDRMKGERRGRKVEVEERKERNREALRTLLWKLRMWFRSPREQVSYSLSLFTSFLFALDLSPLLPFEALHVCGPPFFTQHSRRVDAANCKLISPLHFLGIIVPRRAVRFLHISSGARKVEFTSRKYKLNFECLEDFLKIFLPILIVNSFVPAWSITHD